MIYLDYAATAPLREEALAAMLPLFKENFGNPDSQHGAGRKAAYAVSEARGEIALLLGVSPQEIYFTSGGTEADNWAVRCLGTGKIALSAIEHAAALSSAKLREGGAEILPVDKSGLVKLQAVEEALANGAKLICVMAANNETGAMQPIKEISALCKAHGALLFCDCVQAQCACNLKELTSYADAVALSSHKAGGPKGVGALIVKKGAKLSPLLVGGEQERSLRGGTLNAAGIVGFSKALSLAQREREAFCLHTKALRDGFESEVLSALKGKVTVDGANRLPNLSHLTFSSGEAILPKLDLMGLCASGGAACSAHSSLPSHVMLAMGKSEEEAKRGVRFSFGQGSTREEAREAARIVVECMKECIRL